MDFVWMFIVSKLCIAKIEINVLAPSICIFSWKGFMSEGRCRIYMDFT